MAAPTLLEIDDTQETLTVTADSRDASAIQGRSIETGTPADQEVLTYQASSETWIYQTVTENVDDRVAALIQPSAGGGLTWTYDDSAGTLTPAYVGDSTLVTTGALNSGSITNGFGNIDVGSSSIDGGTITADTAFVGNLTGNASGTSATVTGATQASITTAANLVTVGALDSGSITSNFGTINVGSSNITGGAIHANTSLALATGVTVTGIDNGDVGTGSAALLATQGAVKTYVDAQVTAQDLDIESDSGNIDIDLDSQSLTLEGGTGIDTSATGTTVTWAIDSTVVTKDGTQTLTNKTLTTPVISSITNSGTVTLPTSTDTLVGKATTDTLTNKSISGSTNTLSAIANGSLTNSTVAYGGVELSLGGADTTPAFNLSDATAYPGDSSLVTVGVIGSGTWQGGVIQATYGGSGLVGAADGTIAIADGAGAPTTLDVGSSTAITILGAVSTGSWTATSISTSYTDAKVTSVVAGTLIDVSGTTGDVTVNTDLSELATSTSDGDGDFFAVVDAANAQKKLTKANIDISGFNDAVATAITGTGVLNAGSIASGFGAINNGASDITTTGTVSATTLTGTLSTEAQTNVTSLGTLTSLGVGAITSTGAFVTSSVGPHAVGGSALGRHQWFQTGTFTSDGSSNHAEAFVLATALTGATGDTASLSGFRYKGSVITQASETIVDVSSMELYEPGITETSGASVTNASTLKIWDAPTEGTNNYALWVDGGAVKFDDTLAVGGALTVTGAINATNNIEIDGSLTLAEYIYHKADTDTYMRFQTNAWTLSTNSADAITADSSQDVFIPNGGLAIGGTTTPLTVLDIDAGALATYVPDTVATWATVLIGQDASTAGDATGGIKFATASGSNKLAYAGPGITGVINEGGVGQLAFITANSNSHYERMRIDETGNVGIGVVDPGEKLTVNGRVEVRSANWYVMQNSANDNYSYIKNADTGSEIQFATSGVKMVLDSAGKLGIGTTGPAELLHLYGTGTVKQEIESLNTDAYLILNSGADGVGSSDREEGMVKFYQANGEFWSLGKRNNGYFSLYDHTAGQYVFNFVEDGAMHFDSPNAITSFTGKVGIGTEAPTSMTGATGFLDIAGTVVGLRLTDTSAADSDWEFSVNNGPMNIYAESTGVSSMTFAQNGNINIPNGDLGVGNTSFPTWSSGYDVVHVGVGATYMGHDSAEGLCGFGTGYYVGGSPNGYRYIASSQAPSWCEMEAGVISFKNAAAGTGDAVFTPVTRFFIAADGRAGFNQGTAATYPAAGLGSYWTTASEAAITARHDGGATTDIGITVICGLDSGAGESTAIAFKRGNGNASGSITLDDGTATYNAFTAGHDSSLPDGVTSYAYGTLVEIVEIYYSQNEGVDEPRGILYKVQKSQSAYAKNVLGAYGSKRANEDNIHTVCVLGDGHIICNGENGDIEVGDGICTSSTEGEGMKADQLSMIIGIAQEDTSFATASETKLIPVQYGLRQFQPWE